MIKKNYHSKFERRHFTELCCQPRKTRWQGFQKNLLSLTWKKKEKTTKSLKHGGSRLGTTNSSCKVHEASVKHCLPFRSILLFLNTPTNKLAKFLVPILKPLTTNEFTIKDCFCFAKEILDQQPDFFKGSLDVDFLFTNISLEKTIEICTNKLFRESETVELSKSEFKEVLSLATKDSHFTFDGTLYQKVAYSNIHHIECTLIIYLFYLIQQGI